MGTYYIRTGRLQGRTFAIAPGGVVSVGRKNADLTLPDVMVSRKHCLLDAVEGSDEITDLVSVNGTWVDGERIERAKLEKGNVIRLGETEIEYLGAHVQGPDARSLLDVLAAGAAAQAASAENVNQNTAEYKYSDVKAKIDEIARGQTQVQRRDPGAPSAGSSDGPAPE